MSWPVPKTHRAPSGLHPLEPPAKTEALGREERLSSPPRVHPSGGRNSFPRGGEAGGWPEGTGKQEGDRPPYREQGSTWREEWRGNPGR